MISTSDIVILVVASGALAVGIYRWHENTQDVSAITIPANSRVIVEPVINNVEPTLVNAQSGAGTLTAANNTPSNSNLVVVQSLPKATVVDNIVVTSTDQANDSVRMGSHQVQSGDYLGKIATQYGTDVQTLRDLNNINGTIIQIGQKILYPL